MSLLKMKQKIFASSASQIDQRLYYGAAMAPYLTAAQHRAATNPTSRLTKLIEERAIAASKAHNPTCLATALTRLRLGLPVVRPRRDRVGEHRARRPTRDCSLTTRWWPETASDFGDSCGGPCARLSSSAKVLKWKPNRRDGTRGSC